MTLKGKTISHERHIVCWKRVLESRYIQSTVFDLVLFFLDNPIEKDQDSSVLIEERVINF